MKLSKYLIYLCISFSLLLPCISVNAGQLHEAADIGDLEAISKIKKQGGSLSAPDEFNMTALHFAAYSGHMNVVDYLLDNKVDLNVQNKMGFTALTLAIDSDHIDIAKKLVAAGADININVDSKEAFRDLDGKEYHSINRSTALTIACDKNDIETIHWLINLGANVNVVLDPSTPSVKGTGETLFHKVISSNDFDMVKLFLENGADVNAKQHIYDPIYRRSAYIGPLQMTTSPKIKELLKSYGAE